MRRRPNLQPLTVAGTTILVAFAFIQAGCRQGTATTASTPLTPIGPLPGTGTSNGQMAPSTAPSFMSPMMGSMRVQPPSPSGSTGAGSYQGPPPGGQSGIGGRYGDNPDFDPANRQLNPNQFGPNNTLPQGGFAARDNNAIGSGVQPASFDTPNSFSSQTNPNPALVPSVETSSTLRLNGLPLNDLTADALPAAYYATIDQTAPMRPMPSHDFRTPDITARGAYAANNQFGNGQYTNGGHTNNPVGPAYQNQQTYQPQLASRPLPFKPQTSGFSNQPPYDSTDQSYSGARSDMTPIRNASAPLNGGFTADPGRSPEATRLPSTDSRSSQPLSATPGYSDATDPVRFRRPSPRF